MTVEQNSRKIVKNTVIIYIRIVVTMLLGILMARYVLKALGASDYGLYNVVGSIIALYAFVSGSLSSTTVRFLNCEMGKEDGDINRMFNICHVLHIVMAIFILIISESIGVWYILNYLKVEPGKLPDAMFVFQVSVIVSCIGIINVPYQSLYNVHEIFSFPALLDIFNTILKLLFVLLLLIYGGNKLRFYALSMSLLTLSNFVVYHLCTKKKWPDIIRWSFVGKWNSYKEIVVYNNYTILQTLSTTARNQGSNILINFFFGTAVNAAFAISNTLQNYVTMFMGTFDSASAPQITQNIAFHNHEAASRIANRICRICIIICEFVSLPLFVEMDFILRIWLGTPPPGTALFCRYILIITLVASTSGGIFQIINGGGNVKWFRIATSICFLSILPIAFIGYKAGYPPSFILLLFIVSDICNRICHLVLMRRIMNYDIRSFLKEAYTRPLMLLIAMVMYAVVYQSLTLNSFSAHLIGGLVSCVMSAMLTYWIGLRQHERVKMRNSVASRIKHYKQSTI